jgi:hypothetical protein
LIDSKKPQHPSAPQQFAMDCCDDHKDKARDVSAAYDKLRKLEDEVAEHQRELNGDSVEELI